MPHLFPAHPVYTNGRQVPFSELYDHRSIDSLHGPGSEGWLQMLRREKSVLLPLKTEQARTNFEQEISC